MHMEQTFKLTAKAKGAVLMRQGLGQMVSLAWEVSFDVTCHMYNRLMLCVAS